MSTRTLRGNSESYRFLVEGIFDYAIYMLELDGTIASWNAGARRLKGYETDEVLGQNFSLFYTASDRDAGLPQHALRLARRHGTYEGEGWRLRKDGHRFWASVIIDALHDDDGVLVGFAKVTRDVTERTIREEHRRIIADAAPNGMLVVDERGVVSFANLQAERILGTHPGGLSGARLETILWLADEAPRGQSVRDAFEAVPLLEPRTTPLQLRAQRSDGTVIPLEATFNVASTARGKATVVSLLDITERMRIEEERRQSEAALLKANALMTMAEAMAHYGHWRHDLRTGEVFWSQELYRNRGLPQTYAPSAQASIASYVPGAVDVAAVMEQVRRDGAPFSYEAQIARTDGAIRDVRVSGRGEFENGELVALVGIYDDVTELKSAERERDRLLERLTLATQAAKLGIWEWDLDTDSMVWDARMFDLYGVCENAIVPSYAAWKEAMPPADRERVAREIGDAIRGGAPLDSEFRIIWPNGEVRIIRAQGTVVRNGHGVPLRMVGTLWDNSEVRSLAEELREEKARQITYETQQRYEHERKWSTTFQRAVLPLALPHVIGCTFDAVYEPGLEDAQVGGDWYDAVHLIDGRILISIGDVAGNGLEAAVVVGVVRQIMRGIAQLHVNPMLILDAADRALCLEYPGVYVTAWVGIIDLVLRTVTYASAGHPPPLLVADDGTVRELDETTLPIGLREGHKGQVSTIALAEGDALVLYTDGVTEATRDVLAGNSLLREAAASFAHVANPAQHVKTAVIPNGSHDDVAILVVQTNLARAEESIDRWSFDAADADAAEAARSRFLRLLDATGFSAEDMGNAELVFGELIGNVVRHAGRFREVAVAVDRSGPHAVLHVIDRGPGFRHISRLPPDPYAENGRGLFLIAALTADFTVAERHKGGSHARAVLLDRDSPLRNDRRASAKRQPFERRTDVVVQ